jgi:hypothetical protein
LLWLPPTSAPLPAPGLSLAYAGVSGSGLLAGETKELPCPPASGGCSLAAKNLPVRQGRCRPLDEEEKKKDEVHGLMDILILCVYNGPHGI